MSVRLLIGQPWEHLARMEAAYWAIWAVMTPLQSCRTCSSVSPGPCGAEKKGSEFVLKVKGREKIKCVKRNSIEMSLEIHSGDLY